MAAFVQSIGIADAGAGAATTSVLSVSVTVTVGNTIVVGWGSFDATTLTSVTDNLGNTYSVTETNLGGGNGRSSGIAVAKITVGGTLTTITCNHASSQLRRVAAAEFRGCGTTYAAGAGTQSASQASPGTYVNNQTIPLNGLAVGVIYSNQDRVFSAGSNSGTPSTAITAASAADNANSSLALFYSISAGSAVTSFTGTATWGGGAINFGSSGATISGANATRDPFGMTGFYGG